MPLLSLSEDQVTLTADAFDVRGWELRTEPDDAKAGEVEDLLLDAGGTPRYLVVRLRRGDKGRLLVPLSRAWADASRRVVWVSALTEEALRGMPRYGGDPEALSAEVEERLLEEYRRGAPTRRSERSPSGSLARLSSLDDHRVAGGSADPRSWTVVGGDGQKMGTVADLLVDTEGMKARYLDLDVNETRLELERVDRHVLVPVERVRLDGDERQVVVDGLFGRDMADYPVYTGLPLSGDAERAIEAWFERPAGRTPAAAGWAERSARRFFGRSRRPARGAESRTAAAASVEGEDGSARVPLPDEGEVRIRVSGGDIVIERVPATGGDHG